MIGVVSSLICTHWLQDLFCWCSDGRALGKNALNLKQNSDFIAMAAGIEWTLAPNNLLDLKAPDFWQYESLLQMVLIWTVLSLSFHGYPLRRALKFIFKMLHLASHVCKHIVTNELRLCTSCWSTLTSAPYHIFTFYIETWYGFDPMPLILYWTYYSQAMMFDWVRGIQW